MRVLLDECIDWRLSRDIVGHEVMTAGQMSWASIKNGELLTLAAEHFDVFVTVDRNLSFQQRLTSFRIAVVILHAKTNRLADRADRVPEDLLTAAVIMGAGRRGSAPPGSRSRTRSSERASIF